MFRHRVLYCGVLWIVLSVAGRAADLKEFAGTWAMKLGSRNLIVLTLVRSGDTVEGTWERPDKFTSSGSIFANMGNGVRQDMVAQPRFADGVLHLTIRNAANPKDTDKYAMTVTGDRAFLRYDDAPPGVVLPPYHFERAEVGARVATDWEPNRLYTPTDSDTPSAEMRAIFTEDQRVRSDAHADWKAINETDAQRRVKTRELLAAGALHTGRDYEEASFIFQHGGKPEDYLLAHTLAMIAVSKGDATAIWIAAATLDRYLKAIGQKQVFGTQFSRDKNGSWTQEPYDRELISDALRQQLGVPTMAEQAEQLKGYQAQERAK